MSIVNNQSLSKDHLRRYFSSISTLAGLRPFIYQEGLARGMRGIDGWTGSGLHFTLLPDRALDIGSVWFNGLPVSWMYPALGSPERYEPTGSGWLRTFGGGLLATCGLTHFGAPDELDGIIYNQHGRIGHLPVENLRVWQEWRQDDFVLIAEGEIRQALLFGENLVLRRHVETSLGSSTLSVVDTVVNEGSRNIPLALLYHCNFGYPIVSPSSRLLINDLEVSPRDAAAQKGLAQFDHFEEPTTGYDEQVFFHTPRPDETGFAHVKIINHDLNFGIHISWLVENMPILTQWKMMGSGEYVCGLEPATHAMGARKELKRNGLPREISPGSQASFKLRLSIINNL